MTPAAPSERQKGESAVAFEAFRIYLEAGPARSTAKVARSLGKSKTLIDRWSSRWSWVERVRAFDTKAAGAADDAHLDAIARRSRRQAEIAQLHGEATALVAREVVQRIATAVQEGRDPFHGIGTGELLQLEATLARAHNRAVLTERLALGLTTEQAGAPVPREVAEEQARRLTEAELDARLAGVDELAAARDRKRRRPGRTEATG